MTATTPAAITVQPSGLQFSALPGEPLLAAAIRQGITLPYSCKNGSCGSCKCRAVSGEVVQGAHGPRALTEAEAADGWILSCCATAQGPVELLAPEAKAGWTPPVRKLALRVHALERLAPDVVQLELRPMAAVPIEYLAGQFYDVLLAGGHRRAYSVARAPTATNTGLLLHIRHLPGGLFTDQVFGTLQPGAMLRLEGPFGSFGLQEDSSRPIVLLATGTGLAPILALLERLQQLGSTRPVHLYFGGRCPHDLYAEAALQALAAQLSTLRYTPVLSGAQPGDGWAGRTGRVQQAVLADYADLSGHEVYACGSPAMVDEARACLMAERQLPVERFYADAFTSLADSAPATAEPAEALPA